MVVCGNTLVRNSDRKMSLRENLCWCVNTDMTLISQASSVLDNISLVTASQQALGIPEDMSQALLHRDGRLGDQLRLIEANEKGEAETVQTMLTDMGFLSLGEFTNIELEALSWASRIGDTAN